MIEGCALAETARLHWRLLRGRGLFYALEFKDKDNTPHSPYIIVI